MVSMVRRPTYLRLPRSNRIELKNVNAGGAHWIEKCSWRAVRIKTVMDDVDLKSVSPALRSAHPQSADPMLSSAKI